MCKMNKIFDVLTRKKVLDPVSLTETQLARVLNTFDLTALGVGSTLGVGVYVLAGQVAKEVAGPAVVLSFLIAAIASVFAGLCYAEFGSRVPRAGSAYVYSYVCIGEFVAFIIGWNLILEYVIGSASVAKGLSLYLDTLINNTLKDTFNEITPIDVSYMASYFDLFSFGISLLVSGALAFGLKGSATVNSIFTIINLCVVLFIIIAGSFQANGKNWNLPPPTNSTNDAGGFFPFGVSGLIKGAATCFYGFVGFDCIATTGEEVRNPQKAIPLAIIASLTIIFLAYFGTATVVTLMVPYYEQDVNAPIPHAFELVGWDVAKWIVAIGGIFGLCASLFGAMFPLPRVIYAMASDGVIFKFLGIVNSRFKTPLIGTLLAGVLTGIMSGLFDLKHLVNMMSIGTLLAYTIVAACVLLLRYSTEDETYYNLVPASSDSENDGYTTNENNLMHTTSTDLLAANEKITFCSLIKQTFNLRMLEHPTKLTKAVVILQINVFIILSLALWLCTIYLENEIKNAQAWVIILIAILGLLMILSIMSIATQPNSETVLKFKVPLVPLIPALSILMNIYLMLMLDVHTWIRFGVWMAVGLPIYFISIRCDNSLNKHVLHAKVNGNIDQTKITTNGHANSSYLTDEQLGNLTNDKLEQKEDLGFIVASNLTKSSNVKLKPKAPLPSLVSQTVNSTLCSSLDSLSVTGALAALDEVLTKEELAIGPSFSYDNPFSRKVSIDTVSNVSNMNFEESVVALVHNEDVHFEFEHSPILEEQTDDSDCSVNSDKPSILKNSNSSISPTTFDNKTEEITATSPPSPPPQPHTENLVTFVPKLSHARLSHDIISLTQDTASEASRPSNEIDNQALSSNRSNLLHIPPPPPPPMDGFLNFTAKKITEPRDDMHTILNSKLKPTFNRSKSEPDFMFYDGNSETLPIPSESRRSSDEISDNITLGSEQYAKVAFKLNKMFQRRNMGLPIVNKLTKPELSNENVEQLQQPVTILPGLNKVLAELPKNKRDDTSDIDENHGVVVEEVMKPADIKKKLNEILRSDPRLTMRLPKSNIAASSLKEELKLDDTKPVDDNKELTSDDRSDAKLLHKNLMGNTLKSIKLRKVSADN